MELGIQARVFAEILGIQGGVLGRDVFVQALGDAPAFFLAQMADLFGTVGTDKQAGLINLTDFLRANRHDQCAALGIKLQKALELEAQESLVGWGPADPYLGRECGF